MPSFFDYLFSIRKQLTHYFITGISAFILDISTLLLFTEIFHWRPYIAVVANQIITTIYVFSLNKYWTFKSRSQTGRQIFRFSVVYLYNYIFAIVWMWVGSEKLGHNYLGVRIANIILSVLWNFLLYKYFVYYARPNGTPISPAATAP